MVSLADVNPHEEDRRELWQQMKETPPVFAANTLFVSVLAAPKLVLALACFVRAAHLCWVIDDTGETLVSASLKALDREELGGKGKTERASLVGQLIAKGVVEITSVVLIVTASLPWSCESSR